VAAEAIKQAKKKLTSEGKSIPFLPDTNDSNLHPSA
jgi:hypothetical protein